MAPSLNGRSSLVGLGRLELPTLRLSGVRSNHLSYRPSGQADPKALAMGRDAQPTFPLPYEAADDCVLGRETKTAAIRKFADQVSC